MSEFQLEDYESLKVNVRLYDPHGIDYLQVFPELRMYKEFSAPLKEGYERNKVIAWVVYTFDKNSPYRKKYSDIGERKYHALLDAKFDVDENGKFSKLVENMIDGNVPAINEMIVTYVKMHFNTKYSLLVTTEAFFYNMLKSAVGGDLKTKAVDLTNMENLLLETERELLAGDSSKGIVETLYKRVTKDQIDLSPETISQKIKDKGVKAFEED